MSNYDWFDYGADAYEPQGQHEEPQEDTITHSSLNIASPYSPDEPGPSMGSSYEPLEIASPSPPMSVTPSRRGSATTISKRKTTSRPRRSVSAEGPTPTRPRLEVSERSNSTSSLRTSHLSSTLFDASHGRQMMNRFVECPYSNAALEAMYERRKTGPVDVVGMIQVARSCEQDSLLQQIAFHTLPVMVELNKLRKEVEKQSATILELKRQIAEDGCNRVKHYAKKFGSQRFKPAPGDWRIPGNEYGPGCDIAAIYVALQQAPFNSVGSAFDSRKFFRNFISDIVENCFDEPNRRYVTARIRNTNNGLISLDHRRIMDFVIETCKNSGEALFHEGNAREQDSVESGLLKSMQFALENYRRNYTRRNFDNDDSADE